MKNRLLKRVGIGVGGLAALGLALFGAASAKASARLGTVYETHRIDLPLPAESDTAAIARGKHLVTARYACAACHGENLAGGVMIEDPALGSVRGPNLTRGRGGVTASYQMADWDRIVRHGVKPDGKPTIMPSDDFFKMSDAELSDIVAYIRSVPAVDGEVPAPNLGPVGKVLLALGKLPLSAERQPAGSHPASPPATAESAAFGEHLTATCLGCHRQNLAGGRIPFGPPSWPAAANLTPHAQGLGTWSFEQFEQAVVQGVSKDGRKLLPPMAEVVQGTKNMSVTERKAMWAYLQSLRAAPTNVD